MSIRIGIDGHGLQGRRTGVGRMVWELCKGLDACMEDAEFIIYSPVPVEIPVSNGRWRLCVDPAPYAKYMKTNLWLKMRCGRLCDKDELDVFWGPTSFLPNFKRHVPTALLVYDLNYKMVPKTMPWIQRVMFKLFFLRDVRRADYLLSISYGTAERLYRLSGRKTDAVIWPAVADHFRRRDETEINDCLNLFTIRRPYLLAVATWEPRKNLEVLIETFLSMKNKALIPSHNLVLVGGSGWKDERLKNLVSETNKNSVLPLGFVDEKYLPALYSGAELFVFPSIYEGFGMPVLEARACGTKVVASDIPEIREAGGSGTVYIQPTKPGIEEGILKALETEPPPSAYEPLPDWKRSAGQLAEIIRKCKFTN